MLKTRNWMMNTVMVAGLLVSGAAFAAQPMTLSDAQMDAVTAGGAPNPTGFVCPTIKTDAVLHSPKGAMIGEGHYTIGGPNVRVPMHATNRNGAGVPGDPADTTTDVHAQPGDTDYTAIWYFQ